MRQTIFYDASNESLKIKGVRCSIVGFLRTIGEEINKHHVYYEIFRARNEGKNFITHEGWVLSWTDENPFARYFDLSTVRIKTTKTKYSRRMPDLTGRKCLH